MSITRRNVTLSGAIAEHAKNRSAPGLVLPKIKNHQLARFGPDLGRDPTVIHPSEMAKEDWCLLATYRRIVSGRWPENDDYDFVRENIFSVGNDIHSKYQGWMRESGFPLWGNWKCLLCDDVVRNDWEPDSVLGGSPRGCTFGGGHRWAYDEVHMDVPGLMITGHADAGVTGEDYLVEIKSIGLGTVRLDAPELLARHQEGRMTDLTGLWRDINKPLRSHMRQGDIYLHLSSVLGLPFSRIVYLYEFKPNQLVKEFTIKYDANRVAPLIAKAGLVKYAVEHGIPPECIKKTGCRQCNAFPQKPRRTVAGRRADHFT